MQDFPRKWGGFMVGEEKIKITSCTCFYVTIEGQTVHNFENVSQKFMLPHILGH